MKHLLASLLLFAATVAVAHPDANDPIQFQRDPTDNTTINYPVAQPAGGASGLFAWDGTNHTVVIRPFGGGFSVVGGAILSTPAWSALTGTPTTMAGYGITDGVSSSALASTLAGYATTTALTTGLSGKFNTPAGTTAQYIRGDGTLATLPAGNPGTVTSVTAGTGLSGGTITATGTISMPSVGTAGTYSGVTTDAQGRVTAGTARSFSYPTRSLSTCFQPSATRDAQVVYSVDISTSLSLAGGTVGTVYLRTYTNSSCTTGAQEIARAVNGQTGTLTIGLGLTQNVTSGLSGIVPAGAWVQLVPENNTGTATFTYRAAQEVLL